MPETRRWRTPAEIRGLVDTELHAARDGDPWPHLERAHLLSQPWWWPHIQVHAAMFRAAIVSRDPGEALGQVVRIVVAGPGSLAGRYPPGNTGRTSMSLTATAPVPADVEAVLADHLVSR